MGDSPFKRADLLDDERGRGFPAVSRYGPYLFVAGSDGHRDLATERVDPELAGKATAQCRNSYGRVQRRLERAGFSGDCAVWIQNFTSGQHWRLERMALWPEFFGEEGHGQAVSFGAQTRMDGINMLTSVVLAMVPELPRSVAVKQPARGRASRVTRVGPLTFVIGVRGHADPETGIHAPEETEGAFDVQLDNCVKAIHGHLGKDGTPLGNLVRLDGMLRAARCVNACEDGLRRHFDGRLPFGGYAVGTPLGARCEQEIGGIAVVPGEAKSVHWSPADATVAEAVTGGGLIFARNVSGLRDAATGEFVDGLPGDGPGQVRQAVRNLEGILARAGSGIEQALRFDVFLRDIYAADEIARELRTVLGGHVPTLAFIGAEPRHGAEIEITAIAGA